MRSGAELVSSSEARKQSLDYIVDKLWECNFKNNGCSGCPDKKICVQKYDKRCGQGLKKDHNIKGEGIEDLFKSIWRKDDKNS